MKKACSVQLKHRGHSAFTVILQDLPVLKDEILNWLEIFIQFKARVRKMIVRWLRC